MTVADAVCGETTAQTLLPVSVCVTEQVAREREMQRVRLRKLYQETWAALSEYYIFLLEF